ncbi:hypothetical protein niasHS_013601 [Heterodera schachtii]|uniref:Transmembrane protein n=1 Tax=Heterodera schachtii TaxID=97005 RepID=A0ABD2IFM0_HETSC
MVHPMCVTAAHRLATINNFGIFFNRWHCSPFHRMDGTALTQFRTVRRGGGERRHSAEFEDGKETKQKEEGDEQRHQSSSSSAHFGRSSDPEQILREFNKEFSGFMRQFVMSRDKKPGEFDERMKAFIRDFNKKMPPEFEVERTAESISFMPNIFLGGIGLAVLGAFIAYRLLSRNAILPEHRAIVAQQHSAVSYDEFVQHFLAAGEVRMIYFYPSKSVAVAVLHPGAVIRGQPYHGSAVLIRLDSYAASGSHFLQGVEDAQNRLGIDPREHVPVAIHFPSVLPAFMLILGWSILFAMFFKYARTSLRQSLFKVKRKDGGSKEGKAEE